MEPITGELDLAGRYEFIPRFIDGPCKIHGSIRFSQPIEPDEYDVPSFLEVQAQNWETGTLQVTLTTGEKTQDSIRLVNDDAEAFLPILSGPAYFAVERGLNGNTEEALKTVQQHYGSRWAWDFRNNCRDTLCFKAYADILNAFAERSGDLTYAQFRSGIGYFAKRICDDGPQSISSFETLKERISYWNEKEQLKDVSLPEVIGEKLGRTWYREEFGDERNELVVIGFDPVTFDPEWETVVPACWIAHLVLSEDIEAARPFVHSRPVPRTEAYDELKQKARTADNDRGPAWGTVVAITQEAESDDFRFDGFNYLKHTADGYHGKAKFRPLLYAGAKKLAPDHLPSHLHQGLEFKREIAVGHNWRRDGANGREKAAFERAKEIARGSTNQGYEFNPFDFVEAEASLTHATAKIKSNSEAEFYDKGMRNIKNIGEQHDVPEWKIEQAIEFLTERKQERHDS
ncbi:hypothetical protein Hrd1104_11915 [Halorhabdus sp. CBA1104]|uniref:hypothetical protein n=1 Tax=Halorhabdus sp. CBA1104 TaxID=1380432 RepID=UPI0012B1B651|nr:hypothetical protein [Halorhabdus sp. CBA1104]QGN07928.1 hypothetical protein Hrd1104_11915 [Halorhabdus sp. CBA1104]